MARIEVSVEINSDIFHAWEYYFNQINSWWPSEFHTSKKTKRFIIETVIGGKAFEDHGEGCGLIWGQVIGVEYPNWLQIKGNLTREFGGPAITYEKFSFESIDRGSIITYTCDFIGPIDDRSVDSLKSGWTDILQKHFKSYCDKRS